MCGWLGPQGVITVDLSLVGVTGSQSILFPDEAGSWLLGLRWGCQGEWWEPVGERTAYLMALSTGGRRSYGTVLLGVQPL